MLKQELTTLLTGCSTALQQVVDNIDQVVDNIDQVVDNIDQVVDNIDQVVANIDQVVHFTGYKYESQKCVIRSKEVH